MGLDMTAVRRVYTKNWDFEPVADRYSVQVEQGGKPLRGIVSDAISAVEEEVMTWRKANQIHAWFVDNVQNGKDDCVTHRVSWDKLRLLHSVCNKVMEASKLVDGTIEGQTVFGKDHPKGVTLRVPGQVIADSTVAKYLLPSREGFFFGSTEYDEVYLEDVLETRDWAARMMAEHKSGVPGGIYYSSSW